MAPAVSDRLGAVSELEAWTQVPPIEIVAGGLIVTAISAFRHGDIGTNLLLNRETFVKAHGLGKAYAPRTGSYSSETNDLDPDLDVED